MSTRALVCVKVEEKWYVTHQAFNGMKREVDSIKRLVGGVPFLFHQAFNGMKREVDCDGPEYRGWLEATYFEVDGEPSHREYTSLRRALETELPKDHYDYLHIWQQGKWSTLCMN